MRFTPSILTVSSASRQSEGSSGDSWADWKLDSLHAYHKGSKGNTGSGPYSDGVEILHRHHDSLQTKDGEGPYETLEASQPSISPGSASNIDKPSIGSPAPRYGPGGPMMGRPRGYERPAEQTGHTFGHRLGSASYNRFTAPVTQDATSPATDHLLSVSPTTPAKQMYPGNVFPKIPASQTPSISSRYLSIPPPPSLREPEPFCEPRPSFNCGTQGKSIRPSWYAPGTALLSNAAKSCYMAGLSKYNQAARWYKRGLALSGFRETVVNSALGSHFREMTRTKTALEAIGATAKAHSVRLGPRQSWTQCTGNRTTGTASWSGRYHGED